MYMYLCVFFLYFGIYIYSVVNSLSPSPGIVIVIVSLLYQISLTTCVK